MRCVVRCVKTEQKNDAPNWPQEPEQQSVQKLNILIHSGGKPEFYNFIR
ncbi:MAG: hypothetical protein OJF59_000656 [Cytophagales bacterium]|nr:MAG: hypothetical protein OJF59_000656 [Cytophagales bacterium]